MELVRQTPTDKYSLPQSVSQRGKKTRVHKNPKTLLSKQYGERIDTAISELVCSRRSGLEARFHVFLDYMLLIKPVFLSGRQPNPGLVQVQDEAIDRNYWRSVGVDLVFFRNWYHVVTEGIKSLYSCRQ